MEGKSCMFCVLLFIFVIFTDETQSLNAGDVGTCSGKVNTFVSKKVTYAAVVYCKNIRRNCRVKKWKIRNVKVPKMGTICCGGWQHDADRDVCKPICSRGCLNGTCVAPEKCQCSPPLFLDPTRNYACITPVCDPPCVNSACTLTDEKPTCECLNNSRPYNSSHCAFCNENYKINADLTCTPECETPCINGECVAPNKCKCVAGFKYKDEFTCESDCLCVNGRCVDNLCQCDAGFSAINGTHCIRCECEGGECLSGRCACREGYKLVDGACEPVCNQTCVNGVCSAPGECTCFEGHLKSGDSSVCCRPECGTVCDHNGECPAVACVPR